MKTRLIVGVVLVVHCVAVSSLVVVQGCRTRGAESAQGTLPLPVPEQQVVDPSVGTPLPVVPSDIEAKTTPYIVQPGDSLSVIAHRFKLSVNEIMLLNPKIKKAHDIRSGQKLVLPGEIDVKDLPPAKKQVKKGANSGKTAKTIARNEASAKVSEPAPMMSGNGNAYEVKSGDCLSKIAARNKTTTAAIKKANNLKSDVLKAGQKIVIPAAVEASVVAEPMRPVSSNTTPTATQSVTDTVVPVPAVPVEKKLSAEPVTTTTDDGDADLVPSAPDAAAGSALFKPHTVVQGEDLTVIAKSWGVSEEAIKKANGMANSTVTPGQELKIPALVNP
jgi:LysM repeat protein